MTFGKSISIVAIFVAVFITTLAYIGHVQEKKFRCDCEKSQWKFDGTFVIHSTLNSVKNAQVYIYKNNSKFDTLVDSTNLVVTDYSKNHQVLVKFRKPISISTYWKIILMNEDPIEISNIKSKYITHNTMFSEIQDCYIYNYKLNRSNLITNLVQ